MTRRWRRRKPGRAELIDRKHALEGEIQMLAAEIKRRRSSGRSVGDAEQRLEQLRSAHYRTRLEIDQAE